MAAPANGQAEPDDGDELPTSHLTRPTPDAILADEADENALLGNESDSEHSGSRRDSFGSASNEDATTRVSQDLSKGSGAQTAALDQTPTQSEFPVKILSKPVPRKATPPMTLEELQAQVADLTNQVTGLNSKLVNSFMRVSDLEDDLSDKQQQLGWHREKVSSLEKEREEHLAALNTGLLVEKAHVSSEMQKMMDRVIEETAQRGKAISDKEKIEAELDELSSSLFAEANKMVAVERLARARADEKSRTMEDRLKDTEEIMEQQQKRLVALQDVVEKVEKVNSSKESAADGEGGGDAKGLNGQTSSDIGSLEKAQLPYVKNDLVRLDIVPYIELRAFLNHLRKLRLQLAPFYNYPIAPASPSTAASPGGSRTASPGPLSARPVSGTQASLSSLTSSSALSPFTTAGVARHKDFPNLPANVEQLITLSAQVSSVSFLKRVNEEDCEPCLRLDAAPGLNWLSRRQMHTSILDGNLLIEPVFGGGVYDEAEVRQRAQGTPPAACAMCGRIVLNVPLPGSIAGEASNSTQGAPPTHAREPSGTPPMGSSAFFSSSANNSTSQGVASKLQKKSSTGLFSTLRSMGGSSPRPSLTKSPSSGNVAATQSDTTVEEDPFAARQPPIPTHIFRISDTSTSRYLLCPEYCLRRLRVACNFWSYIRHLERAVVLEGKLAWDDEQTERLTVAAAAAEEETVPAASAEEAKEGSVTGELTGEETAETKKEEKAGTGEGEEDTEKKINGEELLKPESSAEEKSSAAEELQEKPEDAESSPVEQKSRPGSHTRPSSTTGSTDGEDGFADAQSIASSADAEQAETEKDAVEETAAADVITEPTSNEGDEAALPTPVPKLPPLPPRSTIRRPVPQPPPLLPPRQSSASPAPAPMPAVQGPEPKRSIPVVAPAGDKPLSWEDKVWLEMMRHKADMWSARVGLYRAA